MIQLYDFQREALDAVYAGWRGQKFKDPLVVLPTGSGKSVVQAAFFSESLQAFPNSKFVSATHVQELVQQNHDALMGDLTTGERGIWEQAPAGIVSAGIGRKDFQSPIVFGSIQSMANHADKLGHVDVLTIDEAQLVSRNDDSMYQRFIGRLRQINPNMRVLGLTATEYRMDSGYLTDKHEKGDPLFDAVAYKVEMDLLLARGILAPLVTKATQTRLSTAGVGMRGGEFIAGQLQAAVDRKDLNAAIAKEMVTVAHDRHCWLAFCTGVEHAIHMADELNKLNIPTAYVVGDAKIMSKAQRASTIQDFRDGKLRCLTSADVLAVGFNVKHVDYMAMCRAVMSPGYYVQMGGRGMRSAAGKLNCLVSDFAGNSLRHGPIDKVQGPRKSGKKSDKSASPAGKECPQCQTVVGTASLSCPTCSFAWPPPDRLAKLEAEASAAPMLSDSGEPFWVTVRGVSYERFFGGKNGMRDSLMAIYTVGAGMVVREWINLEGTGRARMNAEAWWAQRSPVSGCPATVTAALHLIDDLKVPKRIMTQKRKEHLTIVSVDFEAAKETTDE
jgi:DNA repair protein RadD